MSVNDAFVMDAWGKDLKVGDKVTMLADPQGKFVKDLGLDFDASGMLRIKSYTPLFSLLLLCSFVKGNCGVGPCISNPLFVHRWISAALGGHRSKRFALILEVC